MMHGSIKIAKKSEWSYVNKSSWIDSTFRLVLILAVFVGRDDCLDAEPPHCDATTLAGTEISRNKLEVWKVNQTTSVEEPFQDYRMLDICLSRGSLRINWTMDPTQGNEVELCYDVKIIRNWTTLVKECFMVRVPRLYHHTQLYCWFRMEAANKEPYIHALVTLHAQNTVYYYGIKGVNRNCTHDICNEPVMRLRFRVMCSGGTNRIRYEKGVSIEQLIFNATNSTQCQNVRLAFSRVTEREVEFSVNCTEDGPGRIYLLYTTRGHYCHKYFEIRISCEAGTLMHTTPLPPQLPEHAHYKLTLMTTFIIVAVITLSVSVGVVLVLRRRRIRDRQQVSRVQVLNNVQESQRLNSDNHTGDIP